MMNESKVNVTHEDPERNGSGIELVDDEWDDAKIAALVNFDDTPEISRDIASSDEKQQAADLQTDKNTVSQAELFDDPIQGKTQPSFFKRGVSKASAVGLVMLLGFGGGGLFLNGVFNSKPKVAPSIASSPTPTPTPEVQPTPETEIGNLKTQLAVGTQADQIKSLEKSRSPKTNVAKTSSETPQPVASPPPRNAVQPMYSPPPRTAPSRQYASPPASRTVAAPPRPSSPTSAPTSPSKPVTPTPTTSKPQESTQRPTVDPMERWIAMNRIGSYGNSNVGEIQSTDMATFPTTPVIASASQTQITNRGAVPIPRAIPVGSSAVSSGVTKLSSSTTSTAEGNGEINQTNDLMLQQESVTVGKQAETASNTVKEQVPQDTQTASNSLKQQELADAQVNPAEEASILSGEPTRFVQVGSMAIGQLITPVIWAGSSISGQATQSSQESAAGEKFVVQLAEPIADPDGVVSLPPGTQLIAQVVGVNQSGLTQLSVTQAVIDGQEYALPPGAISIRGNDGQPLMASKWRDKGSKIASADATAFLFGSLAKVGEVMNRPDVESSTSAGGYGFSSSTITRNQRPNLLGAVLEGGLEPLTEQILQRNERRIQEIMSRPDVWYVRAGERVQVFVNQSFEF